jgi:tetratricopeptide (TPR) repeat protein
MKVFNPKFLIFVCVLIFTVNVFAQNDPVSLYNKGQDAHERGDFAAAIEFYDKALKIVPEFPEAEFQKGSAFVSLKKFDDAEKAFRRAIELRPDWNLPLANLGEILLKKNSFAEAEKVLSKAIAADDLNFPAYVSLTELRLKTQASPEVLKDLLAKLVNLTSKQRPTAMIWASRGAIERELGDKVSAKTSLDNALSKDPNNQFALNERIRLALSDSDFSRASEDAKTLVQISSSNENKLLLSNVYIMNGNNEDALKILETLDATDKEVLNLKNAVIAGSSKNIAELEKLLETDAKNAAVLNNLCSLTRTVNPLKSLEYCKRALEIEPNNIKPAVGFAAALVQAKQFENAILILRRILNVAPDNYTAHANLALSLFELKHYEEAKIEYQWLSDTKPNISVTYFFLAICHDNLREYIDSMANYQKFLQLADAKINQLEIDKVNLRLPILQRQIKNGDVKKKGKT